VGRLGHVIYVGRLGHVIYVGRLGHVIFSQKYPQNLHTHFCG